jgi:hypothetical protein
MRRAWRHAVGAILCMPCVGSRIGARLRAARLFVCRAAYNDKHRLCVTSPRKRREARPAILCLLLLCGAGAGGDRLAGGVGAAVLRRDFLPSRLEYERAQCEREDQHCDREQALAVTINAALHRRLVLLERREFPRPILLPCSKHVYPPSVTTRRASRATERSCANRDECLAVPASPLTRSSRMPEQTSPPSRRCRTSG